MLARRCNRPLVQEMILLLIKVCPECLLGEAGTLLPELAAIPFIQQVHPLILDELETDDEIKL